MWISLKFKVPYFSYNPHKSPKFLWFVRLYLIGWKIWLIMGNEQCYERFSLLRQTVPMEFIQTGNQNAPYK